MKIDTAQASLTPLVQNSGVSDHPMQVILQPLLSSEGEAVEVETNSKAILSSLVSSYCTHKGIKYEGVYVIYDEKKRPLPMYSTLAALGIENGQTLLIGKDSSSFNLLTQWPIVVALATITIGLIGILSMSLVYGLKGGEYFDDYGVVMDAGSSKTNTIVYKWKSNKYKGTGKVTQEVNCYAKGGIAKMNPFHLEPVIDCAINVTSVISPDLRPKTPLFFAATAGMRMLNITNATRVDEILKTLHHQLPETHLDVKAIHIISGKDEGIYGWITTNFLKNTLEKPQKFDPWEPTTYGALDMGGASMQISYAVPSKKYNDSEISEMKLYGQTHHVFSQSNLCYGRDEANNRYYTLLWANSNGTIVTDPCAPKGLTMNITGAQVLGSICTKFNLSADPRYQDLKKLENVTFTYVGASDPDACHKNVAELLNIERCKKLQFKECFKIHNSLPDNQIFFAFATYFYTTDFLNLTEATFKDYEEGMTNFCKKNLAEIREITTQSYGTQYCFNAQYIYTVLVNGFGFSEKTWGNLKFVGQVEGKDVGWTLGYMIDATNRIPEKTTPRLISTTSLSVSLVFFILIIIVTAIFLLYTCKRNATDSSC